MAKQYYIIQFSIMKTFKIITVLAILSIILPLTSIAQSHGGGPDDGGLWCYVDVDLKHDKTERGWAYYEILTPIPNGDVVHIPSGCEVGCMGPGRPRLVERNGVTCLKLFLDDLDLVVMENDYSTAYIEVLTETLVPILGWWGNIEYAPKYYTIQLQIKNTIL